VPRAEKPLDLGTGRLCASFDPATAAWLSIGRPDRRHGFIELSGLPPFDERRRGDPSATRRYRHAMTLADHAFLSLMIDGTVPLATADFADEGRIRWSGPDLEAFVAATDDGEALRQHWSVRGRARVQVVVRGRLDRPALAEITEIDPLPPTDARTLLLRASDGTVRLEAPALPGAAEIVVHAPRVRWTEREGGLIGDLVWPAGADSLDFDIEIRLDGTGGDAIPGGAPGHDLLTSRALQYVRGCTALRVAPAERAILTDHRILPLSWTRDAYWQALALLAANEAGDAERVADHLRWLWRRCERPDGRWVRSHHANGARKDLAFQADQQLYPIVELAEYWRHHERLPDGVDWNGEVSRAWDAALEEVDPATGMISSAENAADDPAVAPFIGASQILLWYAAMRLAALADAGALSLDAGGLRRCANAVHTAFGARIASGDDPWAYAVDGTGHRIIYHDANDLPVALAPAWGFCGPDDPGWRATMRFAFSPANPGWSAGDRPGLGSGHTAGPWTLGDVQAWLHARLLRDSVGVAAALARLEEVAFADGMLPEAYSPQRSDDWRVRHWFAWPGAALAALRLLDGDGRLESRLSALAGR
jgi:uncharacterized protein